MSGTVGECLALLPHSKKVVLPTYSFLSTAKKQNMAIVRAVLILL